MRPAFDTPRVRTQVTNLTIYSTLLLGRFQNKFQWFLFVSPVSDKGNLPIGGAPYTLKSKFNERLYWAREVFNATLTHNTSHITRDIAYLDFLSLGLSR